MSLHSPAPLWLCLHCYKLHKPYLNATCVNCFMLTWFTDMPPGVDGQIHTAQTQWWDYHYFPVYQFKVPRACKWLCQSLLKLYFQNTMSRMHIASVPCTNSEVCAAFSLRYRCYQDGRQPPYQANEQIWPGPCPHWLSELSQPVTTLLYPQKPNQNNPYVVPSRWRTRSKLLCIQSKVSPSL